MENINIETALFPEAGTLKFNEETQNIETVILDAELDPMICTFISDETVIINTKDYEYLQLDTNTLTTLLNLMSDAMREYEEMELVGED